MQSSETWIIQSVPVHVSSSITPRHHFFRLLGPWGEKYSVVGSVASVASVAVSHGSHANYEPWLPFEEPGQSNTEGWKGLNGIIRNLTRISSNIFCVWQNWHKWDAIGICISCIFVFVTTRGSGICAARPLQGARGCNWEARAEETEYSHCQLLPPCTSTSTSLHIYRYKYLHTLWYLYVATQHIH